jgi:ribosomal protein L11 methylase PrmA
MFPVNISEMFRTGTLTNKNKKFNRVWSTLKWRQIHQNSQLYVLEFDNHIKMIVNQILNGEMKGFGTGTIVWPAAHVLIKYLEKQFGNCTSSMAGKRVCDIGSGTGITGFAAAIWGANVLLTDQIQILSTLRENTSKIYSQNLITSGNITIVEYNWGENVAEVMLANENKDFDYIFVSDCVLPKLYPIEILIRVRKFIYLFSLGTVF